MPVTATPLDAALAYVRAGLSVIPIRRDGSKAPDGKLLPIVWSQEDVKGIASWKPFTERLPTETEVRAWFDRAEPPGIGVIGGKVSGNLECIDFDREAETLYPAWVDLVEEECPGLVERLSVVKTPRQPAGYHVRYRCPDVEIPGNTPLAIDPSKKGKERTLIETRGEGGYALAPGSPLQCHENAAAYEHHSGPRLSQVQSITAQERECLLRCARYFSREARQEAPPPGPGLKPGEDFDARGPDWQEILSPHGWECTGRRGEERRWRRPGKDGRTWSATTGHCRGKDGSDLLRVFSSNAHPFEDGKAYGKFRAWALLNHDGNWSAAASALAARGYGTKTAQAQGATAQQPKPPAESEPWDAPIPLEDDGQAVDDFPLDVLPNEVADYFLAVAESIGCPVDYPGVMGVGVAAGLTGSLYAVDIKDGYTESCSLYVCPVAPKGSGKTPALKSVAAPVYEEASRRSRAGDDAPAYVSDVTVEKVADILKDCPRGLLVVRDELSGWMRSMDQYKAKGSGSDRQFWLSVNSGDPVSVHRKNPDSPPVFVRHPCVTVVGGIQPPVLARLKADDDGFYDRILFSYPRPLPAQGETWSAVNKAAAGDWALVLSRIMGREMYREPADGYCRPWFLKLSDLARCHWEEWTSHVAALRNSDDYPEWLKGPAIKITGFAARLAGVVHALREACLPDDDLLPRELQGEDMAGGVALARYFLSHARRVYRAMGRDPRIEDARRVLVWIQRFGKPTFNRRDAWRALRHVFGQPEDLIPPMKLLQAHGCIRWLEPAQHPGVGRKPSQSFEVNPNLLP